MLQVSLLIWGVVNLIFQGKNGWKVVGFQKNSQKPKSENAWKLRPNCCADTAEIRFLNTLWRVTKSGYHLWTMSVMESGDRPVRSLDKPRERTLGQRKPCCACGGTDVDRFFGSFWSRERRLILEFIVSNSKTPVVPFETVEFQWFSSMTTPNHTDQGKRIRRLKNSGGSLWITHRTKSDRK